MNNQMSERARELREIKSNPAVKECHGESFELKANADPRDLDELSKHVRFPSLLVEVAGHFNTSKDTLVEMTDRIREELAPSIDVVLALQSNPRLPGDQFKMLACGLKLTVPSVYYDKFMLCWRSYATRLDEEVWRHVLEVSPASLAKCFCAPPCVLLQAFEKSPIDNRGILNNPRVPVEALIQMADPAWGSVAALMTDHKVAVASCPRLPEKWIVKLAQDDLISVRLAVASNPSAPPEVLESLLEGASRAMLYEIARNPACPESARLKLAACDDFCSVLETARRTASEAVFMAILERSRKMDMGKRGKLQVALVKNHNFTCSFLEKIDYEGGFDWEEDEDVEEALVDRGVIEDK